MYSVEFDAEVASVAPLGGAQKRLMDLVLAGLLLLAVLPLMLITALLIKLLDGGPILFGHRRIGFKGEEFVCWKFRSMNSLQSLSAAEQREWNEKRKLRRDGRVTPLGKVLRETSLDELPQLYNVLRGEMSLVGPRPVPSSEIHLYGPHIHAYLIARPGLTGLWQVSGRSKTTYEKRVALDLSYSGDWSLRQDFFILLKTIPTVLLRQGSW